MDKRIVKTRNNIKQTLIKMLAEKPFEEITVKELCEKAETSRITFYTHYSDKIELVNSIFDDMQKRALDIYHNLQSGNNKDGDIVLDYLNILDCILDTYYNNYDFFAHTRIEENPTLNYMYYKFIDEFIGQKIAQDVDRFNPRWSIGMTRDFICSGIRGFISAGRKENLSGDEIRPLARELLKRLLENEVLRKK